MQNLILTRAALAVLVRLVPLLFEFSGYWKLSRRRGQEFLLRNHVPSVVVGDSDR